MDYVIALIVAALLGLIPAKIAQSKGYVFGKWWVYGFLLFIVAIIHACVLKPKNASTTTSESGHTTNTPSTESTKKCPYCAETIKSEAKICRFCGKELPQDTENTNIVNENHNTAVKNEGGKSAVKGILAIILIIAVIVIGIIMFVAGANM